MGHFDEAEFFCPCCGQGRVAETLVMWLEFLRRAWGAPVTVNSGRRCAARNAKVGGAAASRHLIGCAADIRIKRTGSDWQSFSEMAKRLCGQPGWELLLYPTFIHIAVPRAESERTWSGGVIRI